MMELQHFFLSKSSCVRKAGALGTTVCHPGNSYPSRHIGVDSGKKYILMAVDTNGLTLTYSSSQRNFESHLTRFHAVLQGEGKETVRVGMQPVLLHLYNE